MTKKRCFTALTAGVVIGGALLSPGAAAADSAVDVITARPACGDVKDVSYRTGEAHWTITCTGGWTRVNGWVKDKLPFLGCAEVYGTWADGADFGTVKTCWPEGPKQFNKSHRGMGAQIFFRVV